MTKVLLFSGGLDSFCYSFLCDPDVLLYVDNGSRYTKVEIANIKRLTKAYGFHNK